MITAESGHRERIPRWRGDKELPRDEGFALCRRALMAPMRPEQTSRRVAGSGTPVGTESGVPGSSGRGGRTGTSDGTNGSLKMWYVFVPAVYVVVPFVFPSSTRNEKYPPVFILIPRLLRANTVSGTEIVGFPPTKVIAPSVVSLVKRESFSGSEARKKHDFPAGA